MDIAPDVVPASAGNKTLNIGVRSENVTIGDEGAPGEVRLIEPMGDETLIFFSCGDEEFLVAKVDAEREFSSGDKIRFGFQSSAIHFFDADSGLRLE